MEKIKLKQMCDKLALKILNGGEDDILYFKHSQVLSAGLPLSGFKTDLSGRAVLLGGEEADFLLSLVQKEQQESLGRLAQAELIVLSEPKIKDSAVLAAQKSGVKLVFSPDQSSIAADLSMYIEGKLNTVEIIHGELLDVQGVGVLLIGESGAGKSEIALELVSRGNLLVADDAVAVRREGNELIGCSPAIIRHFMDVRGIGIIDIRSMYGAGAIKNEQALELCVRLEPFDDKKDYRAEEFFTLSGVRVPLLTLPLYPGRNVSVLVEVAARNFKLKAMGVDALEELNNRMERGKR